MKKYRLSESGARGWFIGNFPEAVVQTKDFEVCWQSNPAGRRDTPHYHKVITEVQLITSGRMIINGEEFGPGDIYVSEPGEHYHARYLEDTSVVAIKFPSIPDDKYYI
jgi:mannose-6-phosphate isomerase-like protein (cupin superfamily)